MSRVIAVVAASVACGAAAAGTVFASQESGTCGVGVGRYQVAVAATHQGLVKTVYETILDTCTGQVIGRTVTTDQFSKAPKSQSD